MKQKNEDVPYGYYHHQDDRVNLSAEIQHQPHQTKVYEKIGTLCDDPAGLTCSHDTLKRSGLARTIVPFPSFEAAAKAVIQDEIDGFWVPGAYPDVRKFFRMNKKLVLVEEAIRVMIIPDLVLAGKTLIPPVDIHKLYYHPAASTLLGEIKIPYGQYSLLEQVTSNSMAAKAVIKDDEDSVAITNNLCSENYKLYVYQTFGDDISLPFYLFIKFQCN